MVKFLPFLALLVCLTARAESTFDQTWNAVTANTGTLAGDTNWVDIPYWSFDLRTHQSGWGDAALHYVKNNLWAGLRYENVSGVDTTAGVQGQLQVTKKIGWFSYTPFMETSVGIGNSTTYGNYGPGMLMTIDHFSWRWGNGQWYLGTGIVSDFEHYVFSSTKNGNKVDVGLVLNIKFP